jgi:hypothetical protein
MIHTNTHAHAHHLGSSQGPEVINHLEIRQEAAIAASTIDEEVFAYVAV